MVFAEFALVSKSSTSTNNSGPHLASGGRKWTMKSCCCVSKNPQKGSVFLGCTRKECCIEQSHPTLFRLLSPEAYRLCSSEPRRNARFICYGNTCVSEHTCTRVDKNARGARNRTQKRFEFKIILFFGLFSIQSRSRNGFSSSKIIPFLESILKLKNETKTVPFWTTVVLGNIHGKLYASRSCIQY